MMIYLQQQGYIFHNYELVIFLSALPCAAKGLKMKAKFFIQSSSAEPLGNSSTELTAIKADILLHSPTLTLWYHNLYHGNIETSPISMRYL